VCLREGTQWKIGDYWFARPHGAYPERAKAFYRGISVFSNSNKELMNLRGARHGRYKA
jgi:hypothetical protein